VVADVEYIDALTRHIDGINHAVDVGLIPVEKLAQLASFWGPRIARGVFGEARDGLNKTAEPDFCRW
jgi:hypothetical protein